MKKTDLIFTACTRGMTLCSSLLTGVVTARLMGPEGRGVYFFFMTLVTIITQFGNLGLPAGNTYFAAKNSENLRKIVINSIWISIVFGVILTIGSFFIVFFIGHNSNMLFKIFPLLLVLIPISILYQLIGNLLIVVNRVTIYNLLQIFCFVCLAVMYFLAYILHINSPIYFISVNILVWSIVVFIILKVLFSSQSQNCKKIFDLNFFKSSLSFAIKVYVSTLFVTVSLKINVLILNHFVSLKQMGIFSIVSQIGDGLNTLVATVSLLLFPSLVKSVNKKQEMMKTLFEMGVCMFILVLLISLLIKPIILVLFGHAYFAAIKLFYIFAPTVLFYGLISIISQYLSAVGFPRKVLVLWFLMLCIIFGLSLILIPIFGINGAAGALSISFMMFFFVFYIYARRYQEI